MFEVVGKEKNIYQITFFFHSYPLQDHQEEITAQESNRNYLKDLGERLVEASNKAKASDIEYKLAKLDDQWQQLLDLREARLVLS